MKKLLTGVLFALMSVSLMFAQGGVSTPIRSGAALPSGAVQWSLYALTTGNAGLYQCTASPCTTTTQWTYYGYMPALPTAPDNMQYVLGSTPSGGAASNPTWVPPGIFGRQFTSGASTDTLLYTDNSRFTIYSNGAVGVALTVAQAGTGSFTNHATFPLANIGTANVVLTTTTSTINGSGSTATMYPNTSCTLHSLDNANWLFRCVPILDSTGLLLPASLPASALTAASNLVNGNLVQGAGSNRTTSDSGIATTNVATAASNYVSGNLVQGAGANKTTSDSGLATTNVVTQTSNGAANQLCTYTGANKICVPATTLPTAAMPALTGAVTNSAGALATSPGKIDVTNANGFCAAAGANTTAYTCNLSPVITAYVTGTHYRFKADVANTAASTINFNTVGVVTIKKAAGGVTTDVATNDLRAGQWVDLVYDGTNMQMQSLLGNAPAGAGTVTSVGLVGTANQVTVTGASPITGSGSFTLSIPNALNLGVASTSTGTVALANSGNTGVVTLTPASGTIAANVTIPDATDTLANLAGTQTLTGKSIAASEVNSGTLATAQGGTNLNTSGSTGVAQVAAGTWTVSTTLPSGLSATNLTMVTPALGTPSSGTLTNAGGLPLAGIVNQTADTFAANITAGTAALTAVAMPTTIHGVWLAQGTTAAPTATAAGTANQLFASGGAGADPGYKSWVDLDSTEYIAGGGTAQVQTATFVPAVTALVNGLELNFLPLAANTGAAPTLAVNGLTAKPITKNGTAALVLNDLTTTAIASVIYDGTEWQLQNPQTSSGGAVSSVSNVDSTLTISPTTGSVVASLNLGHAQTWTALQTFGTNFSVGGVTTTGATGTGKVVFDTSAVLVTPNLGTPSAAVLTSATGYLFNSLANATGNLLLSNGTNTATFNQTSAAIWLWANTTTGSAITTNASPLLELASNYWTGAASAADTWTLGTSLVAGTNGASTLTFGHTGSTGAATVQFPGPIQAGSIGGVASTYQCAEGTAPAGIAASDLLYCDSTAHRFKVNDNNGTATTPALFTDNLSVFAATTSAQLFGVTSDETGGAGVLVGNASPTLTGTLTAAAGNFSGAVTSLSFGCGLASTTACAITGQGGTSGSATITWPAVASTLTNPIAFSNGISTGTAPVITTPGTGFFKFGTEGTGPTSIAASTSGWHFDSTSHCPIQWNNAVNVGCSAAVAATQTWTAAQTFGTGDILLPAAVGTSAANGPLTIQAGIDAATTGAAAILTLKGEDVNGGSTVTLTAGTATLRGGNNASTGNTNAAGPANVLGGDSTGGTGTSDTAGNTTVRGGNCTSTTGSCTPGTLTDVSGGFTAAFTNGAAVDHIIASGLGTGNAAVSHVKIQSPALSQTTGTTAQTQVTRWVTHVKAGSTTSATATNMFNVALAASQTAGFLITVHVETTQATPQNCSTTQTFVAAVQDTAATVTQQTTAGPIATICSTGTLTLATAFSAAAPSVFSVTPTWTTVVPTAVTITIQVQNLSQQEIALL